MEYEQYIVPPVQVAVFVPFVLCSRSRLSPRLLVRAHLPLPVLSGLLSRWLERLAWATGDHRGVLQRKASNAGRNPGPGVNVDGKVVRLSSNLLELAFL